MSDDAGGPRPPLTTVELRDAKARLAAFAQWVAEAGGRAVGRDGWPTATTRRGLCFVWIAAHDEFWRGREADLDLVNSTVNGFYQQEFGLVEPVSAEIVDFLRNVVTMKVMFEMAQEAGDVARIANVAEAAGLHDPVVTGAWIELGRGQLIYAAWKAAPDGLPAAEYRKLVRHADRIRPSSGAQSALGGIVLLALMFGAVMGVVYIFL